MKSLYCGHPMGSTQCGVTVCKVESGWVYFRNDHHSQKHDVSASLVSLAQMDPIGLPAVAGQMLLACAENGYHSEMVALAV